MKISLHSGHYNIVDSNQVFLFQENQELTIKVLADNGFTFSMVFHFLNDTSMEQSITKQIVDNTIVFKCTNFDDMGTGLDSPTSIAKIDDKEYFLMFWSYVDGEKNNSKIRSVRYTIYSEM